MVVGLFLGLAIAGVVHVPILSRGTGSGGGGGPSPQGLTYHQAENIANQTATARGGGPWVAVMAQSIDSNFVLNPSTPLPPCEMFGYSPVASSLVGTGRAYSWGFEYGTAPLTFNGPWPHGLFIIVSNGTGTVTTQTDPFGYCPGLGFPGSGALPSNLTDSPRAAAVAQAHGGASFQARYPVSLFAQGAFVLSQGPTSSYYWSMEYRYGTCTSAMSVIIQYDVMTGGTNGTFMRGGWSNGTCGNALTNSYAATFHVQGSGRSADGAAYFENLTLSGSSGLTTQDLGLAVFQPNRTLVDAAALGMSCYTPPFAGCGGSPQGGQWYAFLAQGGAEMADYPNGPDNVVWNTGGGNLPITGSLTLEIVSSIPLAGSGDTLEAFSYSANVSGSIVL